MGHHLTHSGQWLCDDACANRPYKADQAPHLHQLCNKRMANASFMYNIVVM